MLKCTWSLSDDQKANNPPLSEIQAALAARDVMLDLSYEEGQIKITLQVAGASGTSSAEPDAVHGGNSSTRQTRRGRPACVPANDLTLDQVRHMLFIDVPVSDIAETIGVSRRTFYRR